MEKINNTTELDRLLDFSLSHGRNLTTTEFVQLQKRIESLSSFFAKRGA